MSREYIRLGGLKVRKIPYPYRAMFAICSDLDETPDKEVYFEIMKFLNTESVTCMGKGVGLEIGNTIYFDMPEEQFSYWNSDDSGRTAVRALMRAGFIDCIHSFGDDATDRSFAERAINELKHHQCVIKVWVDHAQAITNIGGDIMEGYGDVPGHAAYHADILCDYGVKYFWRGRVTSVIGQNTGRGYGGLMNRHLLKSGLTLIKQIVKDALGYFGSEKYAIHGKNNLLRPIVLRDGARVTEFIRCNPFWGGVDKSATADGISEVLTERYFEKLVRSGGVSILYTHLGKIKDRAEPFNKSTREALFRLRRYSEAKTILVTTTFRLLEYSSFIDTAAISVEEKQGARVIYVEFDGSEKALQGFTVACESSIPHQLVLNGREPMAMVENSRSEDGEITYSVPWNRLEYPL